MNIGKVGFPALLAVFVLFFTMGCSEESILSGDSADMIRFRCDSVVTRSVGYAESAQITQMGVYASLTPSDWDGSAAWNLMSNTLVARADEMDPWTYSPPRYWPSSGKSSFFAYAPYNALGLKQNGTTGVPQMEFAVQKAFANQVDLLVAASQKNCEKSGATNGHVGFSMNHALSRISFAAKTRNPSTEDVRIIGIVLNGLYDKGTCPMESQDRRWIPAAGSTPTASYSLTKDVGGGLQDKPITDSYETISTFDGSLFLLPQTLTNSAEIEIYYLVGNRPQEKILIKLKDVMTKWEAGEAIRFLISVNSVSPTDVTLNYSFIPWSAVNSSDISVEANPFLYVSNNSVESYHAAVTRVYFYTNQPVDKVYIDASCRIGSLQGEVQTTISKFVGLVAADRDGAINFAYDAATGKGHFDLINRTQSLTPSQVMQTGFLSPVLLRLCAGKLDYYITVQPYISERFKSYHTRTGIFFYSSVFHRHNEKGERLINWYYNDDMTWEVTIEDEFGSGSELIIDRLASPADKNFSLYSDAPGDAEGAEIDPTWTMIPTTNPKGRMIKGRGALYFRVGWKSTSPGKNRYARLRYTRSDSQVVTNIFCRQGEDPDYIWAPGEAMFSPYNLAGDGELVQYPSQAGLCSQWGRPRLWPLIGLLKPIGYPTVATSEELDTDIAVCPDGYTYPLKESLKQNIPVPGACADGFFDRRNSQDKRVEASSSNVAGIGVVVYNATDGAKEARSVFFPTAGLRNEAGLLMGSGVTIQGVPSPYGTDMVSGYWSSEEYSADKTKAHSFLMRPGGITPEPTSKLRSYLLRCVKIANSLLLSFDANGGDNTPRSVTGIAGSTVYIPKRIPGNYWRPGYFFHSWNTLQNGTGTSVMPGVSYTMSSSSHKLYAQWSPYLLVDFRNMMTAANRTDYLLSTGSYSGYTVLSNGVKLSSVSLSGEAGFPSVAAVEKAYPYLEFHRTIKTASSWTAAYADCLALVDPDRPLAKWRLPRLMELLLLTQKTTTSSWGIVDLFGGSNNAMWSGTEQSTTHAHQALFLNSQAGGVAKSGNVQYRCVREIPR